MSAPRGRGRRWLFAGGLLGLAATPRLTRVTRDLLGRLGRDAEAPFRRAPCQDGARPEE
jgi:hypothetical protein